MTKKSNPFLRFEPIYQKRVWGGRALETLFGRELPDEESPFGESWEISAREEADCVIAKGPLAGKSLTQLWKDPGTKDRIFGPEAPRSDQFPLLCKILDAREKLSVQVHPPASIAVELNGESKSEAWYIADADPGAELYVGVKSGVTPDSFRAALQNGELEQQVHAIPVRAGQYIYIPSGRLHAIGAGVLIYEIQENSDTTFRVYDWNRIGLDGKPRDLHVEESMKCIDFSDFEPEMDQSTGNLLCECEHFRMEKHHFHDANHLAEAVGGRFTIATIIDGEMAWSNEHYRTGDFFLIPFQADLSEISGSAELLLTTWPAA